MRDYVIINGVNSLTIQGLAISKLPSITKPQIRTQVEEIDGRDGDIITELGYSAYDKELEIGLYGNFDIDAIIKYFTGEGTIIFSNEPTKYYNFKILSQIDYEKLLKFKTAVVTIHCQPFKYLVNETPIEAGASTILIKDMENGTDVSGMTFIVDTAGYTSAQLVDGLSEDGIQYSFVNSEQTQSYVVASVVGSMINDLVQMFSTPVYNPDGTSFGTIDNSHYYLIVMGLDLIGMGTPTSFYIIDDLTLNENYGGFVIPNEYTLFELDTTMLPNSVLWNCMKLSSGSGGLAINANNIGNIYAKPILTIEGSGNIEVSLNDQQLFEIALGDNGSITIDVPNLEAYKTSDGTLLNRLVTGDYAKLLIQEGENTITFGGNVTGASITHYTRWI